MASGDTIEAIEIVDSSTNFNLNNSKETNNFVEAGGGGEDEGTHKNLQLPSRSRPKCFWVIWKRIFLIIHFPLGFITQTTLPM